MTMLTQNPKTFAKNGVAHIIDPAEIEQIISAGIPVVGDAKKALQITAEPTVHNNTEN